MNSSTISYLRLLLVAAGLVATAVLAQQRSADTFTLADYQPSAQLTGIASDPDSGALLYTETWDNNPTEDLAWVRYWGPDGRALAIKRLDFSGSDTAPDVFQADFRNRRGFDVSRESSQTIVEKLRLAETLPLDAPTSVKSSRINVSDETVIDAGFNRYVLANWELLTDKKQSASFDFLQMDEARLISLKIKPDTCSGQFAVTVQCFSLNINNRLLSRFVSPITLVYDSEQRRLLRYQGLGQLAGADGKGLVVQIDYRYPD